MGTRACDTDNVNTRRAQTRSMGEHGVDIHEQEYERENEQLRKTIHAIEQKRSEELQTTLEERN